VCGCISASVCEGRERAPENLLGDSEELGAEGQLGVVKPIERVGGSRPEDSEMKSVGGGIEEDKTLEELLGLIGREVGSESDVIYHHTCKTRTCYMVFSSQ